MGRRDNGSRDWSNPAYLREKAGRRTIPVEIGGSYTSEGWRQELMTLSDFIGRFIEPGGEEVYAHDTTSASQGGKRRKVGETERIGVDGPREAAAHGPPQEKNDAKNKAYLAQHQLFDQIPALRRDILTPDYCALLLGDEEDDAAADSVATNAWYGPAGTVSPLHSDPFHNLLAQVVGTKRVRLASHADPSLPYAY